MAILKKGSTGKPVEELQSLINNIGIRPALKVDGIFGPLTDKALRAAQKKLQLESVDGKAGANTIAALKFGKPLPRMETPDYRKTYALTQITERNNSKQFELYVELDQLSEDLTAALNALMPAFAKMRSANSATWPKLLEAGKRIVEGQKKFEKLVTVNPFEAEKLAADIARTHEEARKLAKSISTEVDKFGAIYKSSATKVYTAASKIDTTMTEIGKGIAETRKAKAMIS